MTSRTVAITPAYNEERSIARVVTEVLEQGLPSVVVDDGSTDGTAEVARRAGATVIRLPVNLGVGAALRAGFRYSLSQGYQRVVQIDGDLQHDPRSIPALLEASDRGADLVIGSRFASGYKAGARAPAIAMLTWILERRIRCRIDDPTSGFKVVSNPLLSTFAEGYPADYLGDTVEALLIAAKSGARIVQVDVSMNRRHAGSPTPSVTALWHFARVLFAVSIGKPGAPL